MAYSSEALKRGIIPAPARRPDAHRAAFRPAERADQGKDVKKMTAAEKEEFLKSIDPDMMGFDGREGMDQEEDVICP